MRTVAALLLAIPLLFIRCSKQDASAGAEYELYGKWVTTTNPVDTLEFLRKNDKNIMRIAFSQAYILYSEAQYKFANGKLRLKHYSFDDYYPVSSFKWIQKGVEFEVAAYEVLPYISSTSTIFTYRKI